MITVSVLMPIYNAEPYLGEAIESILRQTFQDFELVAVDDGSADRSAEVARDYARRDSRIRFVAAVHRGITATRNETLNRATGKYIAVMDADDISLPERLAKQVAFLENHPECVLVGSWVQLMDSAGMPLRIANQEVTHSEIEAAALTYAGSYITTNGYMARRDKVCDVGQYRDFAPAEDRDLYLRLAECGQLANIPEVLYQFRRHVNSACFAQRQKLSERTVAVVQDACKRRGKAPPEMPPQEYYSRASVSETYRAWAWWALQSGYVATARKHAMATLWRTPLSLDSWKLLACAVRGH